MSAHLRRGRSLIAGGADVAPDIAVSPLDSLTGVDVVEIASHSSADLMSAMRQHPGIPLFTNAVTQQKAFIILLDESDQIVRPLMLRAHPFALQPCL